MKTWIAPFLSVLTLGFAQVPPINASEASGRFVEHILTQLEFWKAPCPTWLQEDAVGYAGLTCAVSDFEPDTFRSAVSAAAQNSPPISITYELAWSLSGEGMINGGWDLENGNRINVFYDSKISLVAFTVSP